MTTRKQQESRLLGIIVGAVTSFSLVLVASLLPWFDSDDEGATTQPSATVAEAAGADDAVVAATPNTASAGTNSQGRGGGPPAGRGPGSQADSDANADPMSFGTASQEVIDAFTAGSCTVCHSIKGVGGELAILGPHLFRLGVIAVDRRPGTSVEAYIEESILDPDAFIMPNCPTGPCPSGVMTKNFGEILTADQLATIVNYLAVLGTEAEADVLTTTG